MRTQDSSIPMLRLCRFQSAEIVRRRRFSSEQPLRRLSGIVSLAMFSGFLAHPDVQANPVSTASGVGGIRVTIDRPLAPRGSVMLLPLQREGSGNWPRTIRLNLADGRTVDGRVAWIAAEEREAPSHWTNDPRNLVIRETPPEDIRSRPVLLARLPADGDGPIQFGTQTLDPIWRDVPRIAQGERTLERTRAPDRPDPDSPLEYWRWVLLADRLGHTPPPPPGEHEAARLIAELLAAIWLIGLDHVQRASPNLAATLRESLTSIGEDGGKPFAMWVSDPSATDRLLAELINFRRSSDDLIRFVQDWIEEHNRLILWSETAGTEQVRLAMVNPSSTAKVATLSWVDADEYAIAVEVQPGKLTRITLDRASVALRDQRRNLTRSPRRNERAFPATERLTVETSAHSYQITFDRRLHDVTPPGVSFPEFHAPLTLFAAQTGHTLDIQPRRETIAQVRRLHGRWELFIECRRPVQPKFLPEPDRAAFADWRTLHNVHDVEAIILFIGDGDPDVVLLLPESGWYRLLEGTNDGTLQVHRTSHADRWTARVVLPDAWITTHPGEITHLGMLRHHHDTDEVHSSPFPIAPWRTEPGRLNLDLSTWHDLPRPADVHRHHRE